MILDIVVNYFPQHLAIISDTTSALAVVSNNKNASENLNYIIGGLIIIVVILVGSTLFGKNKR